MKYIKSFVLVAFIFFSSCSSNEEGKNDSIWGAKPRFTANFVFIDITNDEKTDEILSEVQIQQLVKSIGWLKGGNVFNGAIFRVFPLSNLGQTKSIDIEMKMGVTGLNGQPSIARKRDIDNFVSKSLRPEIKKYIAELDLGKTESEIYSNLCRQITNLSKLSADKKNVLIFSDMLENSSLFSFYGNEVSIADFQRAEKTCPFPDLTDINIYVVPPVNVENKLLIGKSEKQWSNFFASKNAKSFHFDINLNIE